MRISFSPQLRLTPLAVSVAGDVLTVEGRAYDFTRLEEGAVLPRAAVDCEWLASDVTRSEGEICLTLILPYWGDAPEAVRFPAPLHVTQDGPVTLTRAGA